MDIGSSVVTPAGPTKRVGGSSFKPVVRRCVYKIFCFCLDLADQTTNTSSSKLPTTFIISSLLPVPISTSAASLTSMAQPPAKRARKAPVCKEGP